MLNFSWVIYSFLSGDRLVPDVVADPLDDISVGQTLKRSYFTSQIPEVRKHAKPSIGSDQPHESASQVISHGSNLSSHSFIP